jgi:hydrogenase nickel incorporation protein HypA/HybF
MHELSLAQALVDEVEQIRTREEAEAVVAVTVEIGALSGVDRESFLFAFPLAAEGTALEGALLKVEEAPAEVTCDACGATSQPAVTNLLCGLCESRRVRITHGRDFLIRSVELQKA